MIRRRALAICGWLLVALAATGLGGWMTGRLHLASFGPRFIPMAPITAVAFLVVGTALLLFRAASVRWRLIRAAGVALFAIGASKLVEFFAGMRLFPDVEALLIRNAGDFGGVPLGRISPVTAACIAASGASLVLIGGRACGHLRNDAAGWLGGAIAFVGLTVTLGYAYGTPLLYGASVIPVALPTGVGLAAAGIGLMAAAGGAGPLRPFAGSSARARLLRAFLPPTTGAALAAGAIARVLVVHAQVNPALAAAFSVLAAATAVAVLISWTARAVGGAIDRAEDALKHSQVQLERSVALRTTELMRANEQLAQANTFLDSIVENLPDMIFVKDAADLSYVRFNRAGEEMVGRRRDELIGKNDRDFFPSQLADAFIAKDREVLSSRVVTDIPEEIIATPERGARVLHTKKIPILDAAGVPQYLLGISEDITERRSAHEAVRLARLEAERTNRAKSEFLSRMSHDLRTPLNAILGFAQILEMDAADFTAEQVDSIRQILKGGGYLLELINEVLDIARIEAGHLSLSSEPVATGEAVQHVVDLVRPLAAKRGITISAVSSEHVRFVKADRQRLNQVLLNLVGNAVKYNRDGGTVRVSCERVADGRVRIAVADSGAGLSADKVERLFQPFERLGAEQSAIEGTGLGLALSKGLTEAMGGTIGVHSAVDQGTTFWIELPETSSTEAISDTSIAPQPVSEESISGTVLYVEDNRSNIRLLQRVLARRPSLTLLTASTGEEGLATASRERPNLILLDLHLPDMPGEDVLRRLQAEPATRRIPVAVLSADATRGQRQRLLDAGAVAYLTKPLEVPQVLRLIDERLAVSDRSTSSRTSGLGAAG